MQDVLSGTVESALLWMVTQQTENVVSGQFSIANLALDGLTLNLALVVAWGAIYWLWSRFNRRNSRVV